ncbi:MAG: hypothetical protein OXG56_11435 [Gammaproteobacteria bacterium]|nr:hypothetical protein [Gammaproteobacteria bacterium]
MDDKGIGVRAGAQVFIGATAQDPGQIGWSREGYSRDHVDSDIRVLSLLTLKPRVLPDWPDSGQTWPMNGLFCILSL